MVVMTNNEIFKRLLHLTGLSKKKQLTIDIFSLANHTITLSKIKSWRLPPENKDHRHMPDESMDAFMNALFLYRNDMGYYGIYVFNFHEIGSQICPDCDYIGTFTADDQCPKCLEAQI